jgi:hypothetical protein
MNTRQFAQPTQISNLSFLRNKFGGFLSLILALLAAGALSGNLAQAGNILINPGFEADGNHGSGVQPQGWVGVPSASWYINSDYNAHTGNNYYKVWGAYSGSPNTLVVYQDNSSLPTSTYQADGWMMTTTNSSNPAGPDILWSGDDADFAWLEVSFRDAGGNILALYRSDQFSDTLSTSGFPYEAGPWYDFPITNICQTTPPFTIIGSTNLLVAPAGTVSVRFQQNLYQLLFGGGSCYFDDATLNQISGPVPPQITQVYPGNLLFASNHISFNINSPSSSPISTSNIHLVVNGTDVSSGCTFSGSTPNIGVTYNGLALGVSAYTASITVTDAFNFTASTTMKFDTINPAYVWEAEDYDFTNAQYLNNPLLSSTPQSNSYYGTAGVLGVDFTGNGNNASAPNLYRTNDFAGIGFASETARQKFLTAQLTDPGVNDYVVGFIATGNWMNYSRNYPPGTYNIYARLAGGAGATVVSLSNVVNGTLLGNFQFSGSDWGAYNYIPLTDVDGNVLSLTFDGSKQTLSVSLISGGDNMNFFMLVPAASGLPLLSNISPTNGAQFATGNTFSFTATPASGTTINNSGIQLLLNGADVSSGLVISGAGAKNVSFPLLASNNIYTAVINITNSSGAGITRTVQFDTISTGNFYVKIEDFDYSGGQWDTTGNGLIPNGYIGQNSSVTNVDYFHNNGGNYPYRGPNALATELTSDTPLPGYSAGSDYDVGNFNLGDWGNFTRNYPPGKYLAYGRIAGGNGTATAFLDKVTSGLGTTSQTLQRLGTWSAVPGGWQNWVWAPLQNNGAPAIVNVAGTNTLRVTSGNNINANYFMLLAVQPITISAKASGNNVVISFPTQAGKSYRVFSEASLISGSWTQMGSIGGDGTVKSVSTPETASQQFYQVTSP